VDKGEGLLLTISVVLRRAWLSCSVWHSAQSNHFRPRNTIQYGIAGEFEDSPYSMAIGWKLVR
jgi:hypothetical protein